MTPEEFVNHFQNKYINKSIKTTFLSSIIFGLFAHGYMLTNKLPNYDDVSGLAHTYGTGIASGRWMLSALGNFVKIVMENFSLPWFNGILSICIIGLAACIITQIFDIEDKVLCALTGAIMVSFPPLTCTLFFMYTCVYYCISILICAFAVLCIKRNHKYGAALGMLLLSASLGIYQAHISFAIALLLLVLIQDCMNDADWKQIIMQSFKYLILLAGAFIIYFLLVRLSLLVKGAELIGYQGIDKMGHVNIIEIPSQIALAYKQYFKLFYSDIFSINPYPLIKAAILLLHITMLIITVYGIYSKKAVDILEIVLLFMIFPLAVNLIYVMAPKSYVYSIMMYSMVAVFLAVILLLQLSHKILFNKNLARLIQWTGTVCLLLIILLQCQYNNVQYLAMNMQYEQAHSYMTTLVTRIKSTEGYNSSMNLVFIGERFEDSTFYTNDEFEEYNMAGRGQELVNIYCQEDFLRRFIGYTQPQDTNWKPWSQLDEVKIMPAYPDDGSIKVINNTIVIKRQHVD